MEPLFRFSVLREPVAPDPRYPPILLAQVSSFQDELASNATGLDPRTAMDNVASTYVASPNFAGPAIEDKTNVQLATAAATLDKIDPKNIENTKVTQAVLTALGDPSLASLFQNAGLDALEARIKDSMVALRQLSVEESIGHLATLSLRLRTIETLRKLSVDTSFPFDSDDLVKWRLRPILAPTLADLSTILSDAAAIQKAHQDFLADIAKRQAIVNALFKERQGLVTAHDAIVNLPSIHRFTKPPIAVAALQPVPELSPIALVQQHLTLLNQFSSLTLRHLEQGLPPLVNLPPRINTPVEPVNENVPRMDLLNSNETVASSAPLVNLSSTLFDQYKAITPQSGLPAFTPPPSSEVHFGLLPSAFQVLTPDVQQTLSSNNIDITSQPIDTTTNTLQRQLATNSSTLDAQYQDFQSEVAKVRRVGDTLVKFQNASTSAWAAAFARGDLAPALYVDPPIDKPTGRVTKLLQADLLVVKQQLIGYEKGDIAYIHNVLKSEKNNRETATSQSTTDTTLLETETTTDKQTEITTADRFEMSDESQKTIKEAESLKAGVTLSASYGPAVKVSASANAAMDRSQEESGKTASTFSKDVTNKASDRIQKRVLQRQTVSSTVTSSEKESHGFDNTKGQGNISGVYQWLNKIYEAQTWNYGTRTMLDMMVPEPGAFLLDKAASVKASKADDILVVPPFNASPADITPDTYPGWADTFGVTDIDTPPRAFSRKGAVCALAPGQPHIFSQVIAIDAGFFVAGISGQLNGTPDLEQQKQQTPWITVQCGKSFHWVWRMYDTPTPSTLYSTNGDKEENEVTVSVTAQSMAQLSVNVELLLQRTDEAYQNWQYLTWAKLRSAHDKLLDAQKTAVAQATYDAGTATSGTNPADNLVVMNNEIKKSCIEIMTDQHFEKFHAIGQTPPTKDQIAIDEVDIDRAWLEGPYVRFFEECFEWEEMTWISYPYYWGRKDHWFQKVEYEDPDPLFQKFMQSGYARANVPIRPGFEGAFDHYLSTGKPWDGGPLPGISSTLFLPLATEIQESLGKSSSDPTPYPGGPWKVVVPTTLVKLRKDDDTPVWKKNDKGEWVEAPDIAPQTTG